METKNQTAQESAQSGVLIMQRRGVSITDTAVVVQ